MWEVNNAHKVMMEALYVYAELSVPDDVVNGKRRYYLQNKNGRKIYLIDKGDYFLKVKDSNRIVGVYSDPAVVGVTHGIDESPLYLEKIGYGKIYDIELNFFWEMVKNHDLIDYVIDIFSESYHQLMCFNLMNKKDTYEEIKAYIDFWREMPERIIRGHSMLSLLEQSSNLSRSTICRVLRNMRENEGLNLVNGRIRQEEESE
ncbi:hypothetical protein PUG81_02110 [Erwiniaceae bacterium L1_54_6]|jgi:hypothetical protein|nr:hypothetical protein [Erwiniaceae bacterium L1_54_6]